MVKANNLGEYYSIWSDNRDLNYAPYFSEGKKNEVPSGEYNSDNTERLDVAKMKDLLKQLPEIKNDPLIKL
jgi:UDP-glucose 4-epimerase